MIFQRVATALARNISLVVLLALGGSWLRPAQAQAPTPTPGPIRIQLESPLALTEKPLNIAVRSGRWYPVAAVLTNTGDPVHGTLTLTPTSSSGNLDSPATQYYTEVDLPTNSRKRIWLYGRIDRTEIDSGRVVFEGRGFRSVNAEFTMNDQDATTRMVLTISDSGEKQAYLAGLRGPGLVYPAPTPQMYPGQYNAPGGTTVNTTPLRPVGALHDLVPTRWIGLDAVDMVVLQDFVHKSLTPEQITALRGFVAAGGTLVVPGGENWQRLSQSPLGALWPLQPAPTTDATAGEVSELVRRYFIERHPKSAVTGGDRLGGAPVRLTRGAIKPNTELVAGTAAAPLVCMAGLGAGKVVFLSFDPTQPPFLGWRGLDGLWAGICSITARPQRVESFDPNAAYTSTQYYGGYNPYGEDLNSPGAQTRALAAKLEHSPELRTPPVSYIAWFLALYVFFLVPVNYCVLRFFDKRELAWVTVPIIVVVFSVMSYAAALNIKGRVVRTRQINIVQGTAGGGLARADTLFWLFSPRKTSYSLNSSNATMVVADYVKDYTNPAVTIREPDDNTAQVMENAAINMWAPRTFAGHAVLDVKQGISVTAENGKLVLHNNTPFNLQNALFAYSGRLHNFGAVKMGQTAVGKAADKGTRSDDSMVGRIIAASQVGGMMQGETGVKELADQALKVALGGRARNWPQGFVVAWSDKAVAPLTVVGESPRGAELTLFVFRQQGDPKVRKLIAGVTGQGLADRRFEATVRAVGSEIVDQPELEETDEAKYPPTINTYVCELPGSDGREPAAAWSSLEVRVRGRGWRKVTGGFTRWNRSRGYRSRIVVPEGMEAVSGSEGGGAPATLEAWDNARGAWRALPASYDVVSRYGGYWKAQAKIGNADLASLVRQPDRALQLRLRTATGIVRVNSVRVAVQDATA